MSLNPETTHPGDFLEVLLNDEDEGDSGSELEVEDDMDEEYMGGEEMPAYSTDTGWTYNPFFQTLYTINSPKPDQPGSRKRKAEEYSNPEMRERYPLHSHSPPSDSPSVEIKQENPDSSERLMVHFIESASGSRQGCRRGRGLGRSRGARLRGGHRGEGRAGGRWRPGGRVLEVCLDDADVPPALRDLVLQLESARRATERRDRAEESGDGGVRGDSGDEGEDRSDSDDKYHDAENFLAEELFGGDRTATEFRWSPMASFDGRSECFRPEHTGPAVVATTAYEAFRTYWDDDILEHIVRETNRYATELKESSEMFARDWYDTNVHELMILFAFWMMLGVIRMPSIKSCFSGDPLLKTHTFRSLMPEARYWLLSRALYFVDNSTRKPDSSKMFYFGPVAEHLNKKFIESYIPDQNIVIDESFTFWKGKSFLQDEQKDEKKKSKAAQFGINMYEVCESATGYLWSFFIYAGEEGADAFNPGIRKITEVVLWLVRPLLNQGYKLFMSNKFTSPVLARYLKRNQTDCVGTFRKDLRDVPALIQLAKIPEGACVARHSGDVVVMAYQDKQTAYTISTCHGTESVYLNAKPGEPSHYQPAVIADYNRSMRGIIKKDPFDLEPYLVKRKAIQTWYKHIFKRLLNASIHNSRILVDRSTSSEVKTLAFRLELVDSIVRNHLAHVPRVRIRKRAGNESTTLPVERFSVDHHFIVRAGIPSSGPRTYSESRTSLGRADCVWCKVREHRRKKTVFQCEQCEVPLCLDKCFKKFHTVT